VPDLGASGHDPDRQEAAFGLNMPRVKKWWRLLFPAAVLALGGCSSRHDWMYEQYFQVMRQSLAAGFGDRRVSRQEAAAIPFASLGYRVDGGGQNLLVLASDTSGELLWTAKSHVVILTRGGRIVRTVGLPHDISGVAPRMGGTLPPLIAALRAPVRSLRVADFADISTYGIALNCVAASAGPQTILILGASIQTVRIDEKCRSEKLGWSFADEYWIDPQSGLVWRSLQHIHPKGETVAIEIFRPPG
jgi:hypothetical protein